MKLLIGAFLNNYAQKYSDWETRDRGELLAEFWAFLEAEGALVPGETDRLRNHLGVLEDAIKTLWATYMGMYA